LNSLSDQAKADLNFRASFFDELERLVSQAGSYRSKVISLEALPAYHGRAGAVRVHKLREVRREEVILPERTLRLLERNVHEFIQQRAGLKKLGLATKKGLLFYGPPGTGKTYTIHFLPASFVTTPPC
jgi:ATP-dependent 26S proteasome regulatory subunit